MPNRLARSTSPYLQQHADNPVDWWEWSPEAFDEARRRDVPVLLSVGYAACHWCHVMAAESFADHATAADMNTGFVNVKVDREERPDVDAVYMQATTALTGHGGWPMTAFLTPDGRPFHAGTYYPPVPRHGMPSFRQVLAAVSEAWTDRRDEVESVAHRLSTALAGHDGVAGGAGAAGAAGDGGPGRPAVPAAVPVAGGAERLPLTVAATVAAVRRLAADEDREHGGFGGAPKFPPSMVLEFLLRHAAGAAPDAAAARDLAVRSLTAMARSGIYDHLAGGFARYAVDRAWVVPHFEKMLYDNAQLARVHLHWWRLTGDATGRRVAEETCDWMVRELGTAEGGLASSLDADTPEDGLPSDEPGLADLARSLPSGGHGVEGLTYVWTPAQLCAALGDADGAWAADLLGVTDVGTFHAGASTLRLTRDPWEDEADAVRWRDVRSRLRRVRDARPRPGRDDKVVAAWNGLAIAALAECGALLDRPDLLAAARSAAGLLVSRHLVDEAGTRLRRVSRDGVAGAPLGVLEDHGDVAEGLLVLAGVDGDARWVDVALRLLDTVLDRFADPAVTGLLHDVADDALDDALAAVRRPRDPGDNAYPSGGSAATGALLRAAALTGRSRYREAAEAALVAAEPLMAQAPRFAGWWWACAEAILDGPREIAVVGPPGPAREALHRVALAATAPGAVVAVGEAGAGDPPLLAHRGEVAGRPAAHVCRGFVCRLPVTETAALASEVGARDEFLPS
jgi:hypothetical protein